VERRTERIQKALAKAGVAARRAADDMVAAGRVRVNGSRARVGQRIDPAKDVVEVDGSPIPVDPALVYYLLNKPPGVVTTAFDPQGRPTVLDILDLDQRVWPIGRLDIETEGALILTNDGGLTHHLTHPSRGVPKSYLAEVSGAVPARILRRLRQGVTLEDGVTGPAARGLPHPAGATTLVEITISEGRNRQVRRMFDSVGHPVLRLARTAIGPVTLGRLKPGAFRRLSSAEIAALYQAVERGPASS
jgi:23S rRNA pseudouridine2605 synthase